MEKWRPVAEWEGIYEVSCQGRIRRVAKGHSTYPGRELGISSYSQGYPYVRLRFMGRDQKVQVHKIVAEAFLGPRPLKHEINHKDGDTKNPKAENLEYVTHGQNLLHSYRVLGRKPAPSPGEKNGSAKLTAKQVEEIRHLHEGGISYSKLACRFKVSKGMIGHIICKRAWN